MAVQSSQEPQRGTGNYLMNFLPINAQSMRRMSMRSVNTVDKSDNNLYYTAYDDRSVVSREGPQLGFSSLTSHPIRNTEVPIMGGVLPSPIICNDVFPRETELANRRLNFDRQEKDLNLTLDLEPTTPWLNDQSFSFN